MRRQSHCTENLVVDAIEGSSYSQLDYSRWRDPMNDTEVKQKEMQRPLVYENKPMQLCSTGLPRCDAWHQVQVSLTSKMVLRMCRRCVMWCVDVGEARGGATRLEYFENGYVPFVRGCYDQRPRYQHFM